MNKITFIISEEPHILCKEFHKVDGEIVKRDYGNATWYEHNEVDISNINELSEFFTMIESVPNACVLRGLRNEQPAINGLVTRRKSKGSDELGPHYKENTDGLNWCCMDFDEIPFPDGLDPLTDGIEYLVSLLPAEFQGVTYHYQWSSSAGIKGWNTLSAHVWFWFCESHTDTELQHWALDTQEFVDDAPFRTVQPNYTARPIFIGVDDPLGDRRSGLVSKASDAVSMPTYVRPVAVYSGGSFGGTHNHNTLDSLLADIGPRFHMPIVRACGHAFGKYGTKVDVWELKEKLREAIINAPQGRHSKSVYLSDRYLNQVIGCAQREFGNHTPPSEMEILKKKLEKTTYEYWQSVRLLKNIKGRK